MSTDRDRLAAAIRAEYDKRPPDRYPTEDALADALEGWRPPPRRIETIEDLKALPIGAVVVECGEDDHATDPCPAVWLHVAVEDCESAWEETGSMRQWSAEGIELPVIVVWTPEATA